MKEQFVDYEIAKEMKELGFDEVCFGFYMLEGEHLQFYLKEQTEPVIKNSHFSIGNFRSSAPLWQQAQQWLREEHHLYIHINPYVPLEYDQQRYSFKIYERIFDQDMSESEFNGSYGEYQEALTAAIKHCLTIIKNK